MMMKTSRCSILVFLCLFVMVFHEYEGAKIVADGKPGPSITRENHKKETKEDGHHLLVQSDKSDNHSPKQRKVSKTHHANSQAKPAADPVKTRHHGQSKVQHPKDKKEKQKHFARLDQFRKSNLTGSPMDILCQIIAFINQIFNLNLLSDICSTSKSNQTTINPSKSSTAQPTTIKNNPSSTVTNLQMTTTQQNGNTQQQQTTTTSNKPSPNTSPVTATQPSTQQTTTLAPPVPQNISFASSGGVEDNAVLLTCEHVPGIIIITSATFGSADSSCPPTSVVSFMNQYSNNKTSLLLTANPAYFGGLCANVTATKILNGTYTCNPVPQPIPDLFGNSLPVPSRLADAFDGTQFVVTCSAGGNLLLDSAMYGSFDGVTCPSASVMSTITTLRSFYSGFASASNNPSFSVYVSASILGRCNNTNNKLSITYRCQSASASMAWMGIDSSSVYGGSLRMVCPSGTVSVSALSAASIRSVGCSDESILYWMYYTSALGMAATDIYMPNTKKLPSCFNETSVISARYSCIGAMGTATRTQWQTVAIDNTYITLTCPAGKKIHVTSSNYYCQTKSSVPAYPNPAGLLEKCEGKQDVCYFYVASWNVLGTPYSPTIYTGIHSSAFPNCLDTAKGVEIVMLSVSYNCI